MGQPLLRHADAPGLPRRPLLQDSEGEMMRLETLIELEFLNSSFSSLSPYLKLDRRFPVEQFEASRAIRGSSI